MTDEPTLPLAQCNDCHGVFLPRAGACPRCGSRRTTEVARSARGRVLAAIELANPPAGFAAPHRLALVELAESVRVLGRWEGAPLAIGDAVVVRLDSGTYRFERPA